MDTYYILFLGFILVVLGFIFWIIRTIKLYKKKRIKTATINASILGLLLLFICWELRIIPLSTDVDFMNQTKDLTGKKFWCWNEYRYEEIGIRGEGFTFEIYKLNEEMATYFAKPDKDFFTRFPIQSETTTWDETPVLDTEIVNYVTPIYGNWSESLKNEMKEKQKIVKQLAYSKGSYYAIRRGSGTDLYLISPEKKLFISINHNM